MQDTKKSKESLVEKILGIIKRGPDFFVGEIFKDSIERGLDREVEEKAGIKYKGGKCYSRWGTNPGSILANGEKIPIQVPRLKEKESGKTTEPEMYKSINRRVEIPKQILRAIINGLSQRKYKHVAQQIAKGFGLSQSVISRKFQKSAEKSLKEFMMRDLGRYEFVAIMIDGKYFAKEQIVHAVGITSRGDKIALGFVHTTTENSEAVKGLFKNLIEREFRFQRGILVVCDGSKGIRKAVDEVFGEKGVVQRCQWHKRENVVSYLPDNLKESYKKRIYAAYAHTQYERARAELMKIAENLGRINPSAENSLLEGLEETLTIHRLGLREELGKSLSTTNIIENFNSQLEKRLRNVKRWRPGRMRSYWVSVSLIEIEQNTRRLRQFGKLHLLQQALAKVTNSEEFKIA